MSKILITGGAGFIGCALGSRLVADGHEVVAFDNLHPQVHADPGLPKRLSPKVQFVPGDVTVASNLAALFKYFKPDSVVHLAAETGTGQSLTESARHASVNVLGTANLLDALTQARHVPAHLLISSSRAVYGDGAWKDGAGQVFYPAGRSRSALEAARWNYRGPSGEEALPLPHDAALTRTNPISVYGATKLTQEYMLAAWARAFGSTLTTLRLQNVYGPGQAPQNAYTGILTLFVRLARERKQLQVYEDGAIVRDFVHVEDVVRAMTACIEKRVDGTFDIGSGQASTILDAANGIARLLGAPTPVVTGAFRDGDVRAASCTIEAARAAFSYRPEVSLEQGLKTISQPEHE